MLDAVFANCLKSHHHIEELSHALGELISETIGTHMAPPLFAAALLHLDDAQHLLDSVSEEDRPYVDNLQTLGLVIDWETNTVRPEKRRNLIVSPMSDDVLVSPTPSIKPLEAWGPLALMTHAALSLVKPTRQAAVVATMRDDGVSILEFVAHYRSIGFDEIFIYSNDNGDGSDELFRQLADQKIITFIENRTSGKVSPQVKAFAHSIHFLPELRDFEWVFYADSDEMLSPGEEFDCSISNLISAISNKYLDKLPSAACYQWKWFNSNYALHRTEGLLLERFCFREEAPPRLVKSLVKLTDVISMRRLHFPECYPGSFFVDPNLGVIEESLSEDQQGVWNYNGNGYLGGALNHYWCKSFEEFVVKKSRGDQLKLNDDANAYKRDFELFFTWNGNDVESKYNPPPAVLLERVKAEILALLELPKIADIRAKIDRNFQPYVLKLLGSMTLEDLYKKTQPGGFDEAGYLEANPDVAAAVAAGLCSSGEEHFKSSGRREGRSLRPGFRAPPLALPFPLKSERRDEIRL